MSSFDLSATPLARGTTLIEASAGTGKTYTITGLCVRLIVEEQLTIDQLLVTTFTIPATAELRDRIRLALRDALAAFSGGEVRHSYLRAMMARQAGPGPGCERLRAALRDFDQATITTLHGFCHAVLKDRAFESGGLFDSELIPDESAILSEVADDYWRKHFYCADPLLAGIALAGELGPNELARLLAQVVARPRMQIVPHFAAAQFTALRNRLSEQFAALRACWNKAEKAIRRCFAAPTNAWANKPYNDVEAMARKLDSLGACFLDGGAPAIAGCGLEEFTRGALDRKSANGACAPPLEFFDLCETFLGARDECVVALEADFLAWGREELRRRKRQRNVMSFDDLLTRLDDALDAPGGGALAAAIRKKFRAALIDEFQDTDPVQDAIFQRIFHGKDGFLFLIGDPKQAIFGFRGADVFTYCAAAARADHPFTLAQNFRSTPKLIDAVNALFTRAAAPFILPEIRFTPATASDHQDRMRLRIGKEEEGEPPFQLWLWKDGRPISTRRAEATLPLIVAAEIARLLRSEAMIGSRKLQPSDFAVLVARNLQAQKMQSALREFGLRSVLFGNSNVFKTEEAAELRTILVAVAECAREPLLRAALATVALGADAAEFDALSRDVRRWESRLLCFQRYHERWRRDGFMQMFRELMREQGVRARLLGLPDGERRLTNFLHLAELLHATAMERRLGISGTVKWLAEQTTAKTFTREEHELRLESDANAIQVVTMHKSKGLEYNIVFCPFAWRHADLLRNESIAFHDRDNDDRLTLDLGSARSQAARAQATSERLAEDLRLLYVTVTRARHRCYVVWGRFNRCENSAANWLLHAPKIIEPNPAAALIAHMRTLPPAATEAAARDLEANAPHAIAVEELALPQLEKQPAPAPGEPLQEEELRRRTFSGTIERDWRIASFSSLIAGGDAEQPDFDRIAAPAQASEEIATTGIHDFPRGVKAGLCLHEILEEIDFQAPATFDGIIARKLATFGFDTADFRIAVRKCVDQALQLPLAPGLSLDQVGNESRLDEIEFYLPMSRVDAGRLSKYLGALPTGIGRLQFEPQRGYLKGFIDLVFQHGGKFYIVDWKSNWLAPESDGYTPAVVAGEMTRHRYLLQSRLYILALHRYLALRLPLYDYDKDFGGVYYLFLRGLDRAEPARGVFRDRPSAASIEKLSALFAGTEQA